MEQIDKYDFEEILLKDSLIRIGDLINMDGPMLVLYKNNRTNDMYLFDWVDNDEVSNRWLIYKVDKDDLSDFIKTKISYKSLFDKNSATTYFTDIKSEDFNQYKIYKIKDVPAEYIPDKDVLFDSNDSKNLDAILKILNLDNELNEKDFKQYNIVLDTNVMIGFATQSQFISDFHHSITNHLAHIGNIRIYTQANVPKSNRIFNKKGMVLQ